MDLLLTFTLFFSPHKTHEFGRFISFHMDRNKIYLFQKF